MKKSEIKKDIKKKCKDCDDLYKTCNGEIYNHHKKMGAIWICPLYLARTGTKQSVNKLLNYILAHCNFCLAGTDKENCVSPDCSLFKYLKSVEKTPILTVQNPCSIRVNNGEKQEKSNLVKNETFEKCL
jgi:hypothetical protein